MATGDELLILDSRDADREGLRKLFEEAGYVCTATGRPEEARELVGRKFFPAALVDLDAGKPGQGLDVARAIRERSRATSVVLLTGRRSFEAAVEALRLGLDDVVLKKPEHVAQLRLAVDVACDRHRAGEAGDGELLREVTSVLDDAFRVMLKMAREKYADISLASVQSFRPRLLVVDSEQENLREIAGLIQDKPWEVAAEMNGGSALDKSTDHRFDVIACRADLPDLRGTMVVKSIQAEHAETVGMVYSSPGPEGRIDLYREGRLEESIRPFGGMAHLVAAFDRIVDELSSIQRDRRVIQVFRAANQEFFRRYAELKGRLARLLE